MLSWIRSLAKTSRKMPAGVDVSSYQGAPGDWIKAAGNISWAAVKLTELEPDGTRYVNPDAQADWDWLKNNKKGRIAYLFGHPSVSATETVDFFGTEVHKLGLHDDDAIALDLEVTDGKSAPEVAAWAADVQHLLATRHSRPPLLYTFLDFATAGNTAHLGDYPLWIADPSRPAGQPQVPAPWTTWAIHQYSISGAIDRDVGNYADRTAMFKALGKSEEPDLKNLGGSVVTGLAAARWPDGQTVVAGLGKDGFIQAIRWENGSWGEWKSVSPGKSTGAPGLMVWINGQGRLFYIDESAAVIELITADHGKTWT